jgi:predicted HAD superfamily Cof-like phosphohydrolase
MAAVRQWHKAAGEKRFIERDSEARDALISLRARLIQEEFKEVLEALLEYRVSGLVDEFLPGASDNAQGEPLEHLAKELADLLYVIYGTADLLEIPLEAVFAEVHRSNMTKVVNGEVIRREDGKILKPDSYREADVHGALTGEWL